MTTLAATRDALDILGHDAARAAAALSRYGATVSSDLTLWPPTIAPHGPHAARQVAQTWADIGMHSHLVAHGETMCLAGHCPAGLDTLAGLL